MEDVSKRMGSLISFTILVNDLRDQKWVDEISRA